MMPAISSPVAAVGIPLHPSIPRVPVLPFERNFCHGCDGDTGGASSTASFSIVIDKLVVGIQVFGWRRAEWPNEYPTRHLKS